MPRLVRWTVKHHRYVRVDLRGRRGVGIRRWRNFLEEVRQAGTGGRKSNRSRIMWMRRGLIIKIRMPSSQTRKASGAIAAIIFNADIVHS